MLTTAKQVLHLLSREPRGRWVLLLVLALLVTATEMVGAVLVYTLLSLVADPGGSVDIPVLGDARALADDIGERSFLLVTLGVMAGFFVFRGGLKVTTAYAKSRIAHNAGARVSTRLIEGFLSWPYARHLRRTSAELIRNGHQVVMETVRQILLPMLTVFAESLVVVGLLIVLVVIAPVASGLAVLVVGGAALLLLLVIHPKLKTLGRTHHRESARTLKVMQEAFGGIRDVKLLGRERFFARRYGRSRMRMARAKYLRSAVEQLPPVVTETALIGFILLYFALVIVQRGEAQGTLSVLGLFAYAGLRLQPSLQQVVKGLNNLKFATASVEDLDRDLRSVEALQPQDENVEPLEFTRSWELHDVRFRYEGAAEDALVGVNLSLRPGEQIGICGPTGGGKTTLVDIMTGLLEPTDGVVTVDGHDLRDVRRRWHRALGVVPQMIFLTDDTVRRNIALGVPDHEMDEAAVEEAVRMAQLEQVIAELPHGLDTVVGERGVRISGGQRQRLAIARALYRRPQVLIFDEGTSALDSTTESHLMAAIEGLRGKRTIVLIAHRLSTVRQCDRVIFVEQGEVSDIGTFDELVSRNDRFRDMASTGG